jgi:ActR/RegA family two-component response regulator
MGQQARLLLIGASVHRNALVGALPNCDVLVAEQPLQGLWQAGQRRFERAFVSLDVGAKALRAVSSLRQVAPEMRIVVGCTPTDEPLARRALAHGADDYVLEPIRRDEVEQAFGLVRPRPLPERQAQTGPSSHEIVALSKLLQSLGDGTLATFERLTTLLQQAFDARGIAIQLDELASTTGDVDEPVLEEIILRGGKPVGRIALARRKHGTYAADTAVRLGEYARLVEATIVQARERERWRELAWADDLSGPPPNACA